MAQCELCGRTLRGEPIEIRIEGAVMQVCEKCAKLGEPIRKSTASRSTSRSLSSTTTKSRASPRSSPRASPTLRRSSSPKTSRSRLSEQELDLIPNYGETIRKARRALGMSQQDLARKINESVSLLQHIETQKMRPTDKVIAKLERVLNIKLLDELPDIEEYTLSSLNDRPTTLGDLVKIKKSRK